MGQKYFQALENSIARLKRQPKTAERDERIKKLEGMLGSAAHRNSFVEPGDLGSTSALPFEDKLYKSK